MLLLLCICFFFNDTATTEIYTLSLHDALPIWRATLLRALADALEARRDDVVAIADRETALGTTRLNGELNRTCYQLRDRKSTRLNSSHANISYAVFCLKKISINNIYSIHIKSD